MMRNVAIVLGLAWTFLLAWSLSSEIVGDIRQQAWPFWGGLKILGEVVLLQGTMAFLCFAAAAVLGRAGSPGTSPRDAGQSEEP